MYAGVERGRRLQEAIQELDEIDMDDCKPPEDLEKRVREMLEEHPAMRWDGAVEKIARK